MLRLGKIDVSLDITNLTRLILDNMDDDGRIVFESKTSTPLQLEAIGALSNYQIFSGKQGIAFDLENMNSFFSSRFSEPNETMRMYFNSKNTVSLGINAQAVKSYSYYLRAYPKVANPAILKELLLGLRYMKFNGPIFKGVLEGNRLLSVSKTDKNEKAVYDAICAALCVSQIALRSFPNLEKNSNITSHILDSIIHGDHYTPTSIRALTVCLENRNFIPAKTIEFHSIVLDHLDAAGNSPERVHLLSEVIDYLDASLGQVPENLHVKSREAKEECVSALETEVLDLKRYMEKIPKRLEDAQTASDKFKILIRACQCINAAIAFDTLTTLLPNAATVRKLRDCNELWDLPISHERKMSLINAIAKALQ